ncbi:hypothetical protein HHL16_03975 [Pseudoflavitalea sp. G-6-1-2]|uniref:DUF6538 domain-containing protein n=1 Tax=Pseudoflavitalea sp. G-6-1-2 TaxID=2728841 RepID=UPI001469A8D1|nr:DUF6538 domain-containing protein [Pseudoflavitalea sp. G-6-1-2]NML20016.1 hypothetical protein [Pseudoflavitalea sp. G-6-1-2]
MQYLTRINNHYYFYRRIPEEIQEFDPRKYIRISLKTDCQKVAQKLALARNDQIEAYWNDLVQTGQKHCHSVYQDLVKRAKLFGFSYVHNSLFASLPINEVIERYTHVEKEQFNERHVEAVLGKEEPPALKVDEALVKYWGFAKDRVINKSPNQFRKWRNPRQNAIENFINCIGNKELSKITRDDILKFRDWWLGRIEKENLAKNSANKNFTHVKDVIETVSTNLKLGLDIDHLFVKLFLSEDDAGTYPPFEMEWLVNKLLKVENFIDLDSQAMWAVFAFSETGAGLAELLSLLPEDIHLNTEVPYISIKRRRGKSSKTMFRPREIPLVGFALDAFRSCPKGFTDYLDQPDTLGTKIGVYLRERALYPSDEHVLYSLRHSFQDRLIDVDAPDRVQAELIGHKFNRQKYGKGPTLQKKMEWMKKVQLKAVMENPIS